MGRQNTGGGSETPLSLDLSYSRQGTTVQRTGGAEISTDGSFNTTASINISFPLAIPLSEPLVKFFLHYGSLRQVHLFIFTGAR